MNNNNSTNLSKINTTLFGNNTANNAGNNNGANSYGNGYNANAMNRAVGMLEEEAENANSVSGGRRRRARKTRRHSKAKRHTRRHAKGKKSLKNRKH